MPAAFCVFETVAFAAGFEDVAAMSESVKCGTCQAFTAEYFGPILEREIRRDDETQAFIGGADHIEQQFRA